MSKKIVKKTKVKLMNMLLVLLVFIGLFFAAYLSLKIKIKNIVIKGNDYLNDDYIIELAKAKNYPSFILLKTKKTEKNIKKSEYISECKIRKKLGFILEIEIKENKPLFYDTTKKKYVLSNNEVIKDKNINYNYNVPRLLNYIPDKKYKKFIKGMNNIKYDVLLKISDIEYQPNEYDKDRFLLYMDDGNIVYLTLTKFKMINHYNEVVTQLEGHKGILYLDSGNHFKIME